MILAVNVNAAVDRIFFIDRFVPGAVMRPSKRCSASAARGWTVGRPARVGRAASGRDVYCRQNGEILAELLREHDIPAS